MKSLNLATLHEQPQEIREAIAFYAAYTVLPIPFIQEDRERHYKALENAGYIEKVGTLKSDRNEIRGGGSMSFRYGQESFNVGDRVRIHVKSRPGHEIAYEGVIAEIEPEGFWWLDEKTGLEEFTAFQEVESIDRIHKA